MEGVISVVDTVVSQQDGQKFPSPGSPGNWELEMAVGVFLCGPAF